MLTAGAVGSPHLLELSGIGRPEVLRRHRRSRCSCAQGRRREFAGPSAIARRLQDRRRAHAQRRIPVAVEARWMGIDYALARRGPLTMAPSQVGIFAETSPDYADAQCRISRAAAVARQIRRSPARIPGDHAERLQLASSEPGLDPRQERQPRGGAAKSSRTIFPPTKTSASPPLPSGWRGRSRRAGAGRSIARANSGPAPNLSHRRRAFARRRRHRRPRSSIPSARRRWAVTAIPTPWSTRS